jgi:hypothetical protein
MPTAHVVECTASCGHVTALFMWWNVLPAVAVLLVGLDLIRLLPVCGVCHVSALSVLIALPCWWQQSRSPAVF